MPRPDASDADALASYFATLAVKSGAIAMEILAGPGFETRYKNDNSPVTEADERVETFLLAALSRDLPHIPYIAEESAARGVLAAHGGAFLLIDPIDGTREFLARSGEFTINLALVRDGAPVAGAVYAPARRRVWFGGARAFEADATPGGDLPAAASWRALRTRAAPMAGMTALVSKSHLDPRTVALLDALDVAKRRPVGSSLKFCLIARGDADIYPRFGPTMEWDTAAGDAVLRAAGGVTLDPEGRVFPYGKAAEAYRNGPFVAWGKAP